MNNLIPSDGNFKKMSGVDLRFRIDEADLLAEVETDDFSGQERALTALETATNVGYNIYISGMGGFEDLKALKKWFDSHAKQKESPGDFIYVNNFRDPDAPHAIYLRTGDGTRLKKEMHELIHNLRRDLPAAFRKEAFDREKLILKQKYQARSEELSKSYDELAKEKGFLIQSSPDGKLFFIPVLEGKPLENPEEFANLSDEQKSEIEKKQEELTSELEKLFLNQREILREMEGDIRMVERKFGESILSPLIQGISKKFENDRINLYLEEVQDYILENLDRFKDQITPQSLQVSRRREDKDGFLEFDVNVVVDNSRTQGAPVILESSPSYINLFGNIERVVDRYGKLVTNYTRIKSGSLLRAHGGFLIINIADALGESAVWKTLKRTLKTGRIEIETYEPFALFSTTGLKPESVSVNTTVIVYGSYYLFSLLYLYDEDFPEVFKIRADFRNSIDIGERNIRAYVKWIRDIITGGDLPIVSEGGIRSMIEFGVRRSEDRKKIAASRELLGDLVRESAHVARKGGSAEITAEHVKEAIRLRQFRSNRIEEDLQEMTENEVILIDLDGKKVGQINGLSVLNIGDYMFGRPSRLTASISMGQSGIINIEREAKLSGKIHDKGVFILTGYLRSRYGKKRPLNLTASISFEQSYSGVEGDSASAAELYAILSALSEIPLRQDIGVTGSVNQLGQIQAIGGVNEKIEGFFGACRARGLTGNQGVMIPASNIRNLILNHDVIEAVEKGVFHIYPFSTIDEGIEILTGYRAGDLEEKGTVNYLISMKLEDLAKGLKEFDATSREEKKRENSKEQPGEEEAPAKSR
jgi:ATP-dependent Lon protease